MSALSATIAQWLTEATNQLKKAGIETARLDCLILLEDVLHLERAHLLAHPDTLITQSNNDILNKKIAQRLERIPLAYIRGMAFFYGRSFLVSPEVLCPRPETEALIDLLLPLYISSGRRLNPRFVDLGTGSGCIGITAALEVPGATVELRDIDSGALGIAKKNARRLGVRATFCRADLLSTPTLPYDVLLANLPYVPDALPINKEAQYEPKQALFAGSDGLDLYERLWDQQSKLQATFRPHTIITESFPNQHASMRQMATKAGFNLEATNGFGQLFIQTA